MGLGQAFEPSRAVLKLFGDRFGSIAVGDARTALRRGLRGSRKRCRLTYGNPEEAESQDLERESRRIVRPDEIHLRPVPLDDAGLQDVVGQGLCETSASTADREEPNVMGTAEHYAAQPGRACTRANRFGKLNQQAQWSGGCLLAAMFLRDPREQNQTMLATPVSLVVRPLCPTREVWRVRSRLHQEQC